MIDISYLQNIYRSKDTGERVLHRSHVTGFGFYDDWATFVADFFEQGVMPSTPSGKGDAYGWCATLFEPSGEEKAVNENNERHGNRNRDVLAHRRSEYAHSHLTLWVGDLDNHIPDQELVSIDALEGALKGLGLSYVLYTSFSHKPERHKVRIIMPVSRHLTPDEAFEVFKPFNYALNFQLDASIYGSGDFLYGPPVDSDVRIELGGQSLDVDHWIGVASELPPEVANFVTHASSDHEKRRASPEEIAHSKARFACVDPTGGVSVQNPRYFNPEWFKLADDLYLNGSHWESMIGLLAKAWLKSGCELSRFDMQTLQDGLDDHWVGYLTRHYPRAELDRAVRDAMKQVGTPRIHVSKTPSDRELRAAQALVKRKYK